MRSIGLKFGSFCSLAVGILYILVGATHLFLPRGQLRGAGAFTLYESLARNSTIFSVHYWIVVVLSILSIGVMISLYELLRDYRSEMVSWAIVLGLFGAGLSLLDYAYVGVEAPRFARLFVSASDEIRSAMANTGLQHIDPCFLSWGLLGIFAVTINASLLHFRLVKPLLGFLGLIGGVFYFLLFIGALFHVSLLIDLSAVFGGIVLAPIWYIWIGFVLSAGKQ